MPNESTPNGAPAPLARRLATILCADIAGYSQMMGVNEERTVRVFRGHREIFESLVNLHRGRIFNTAGDALLADFNSAVEAVRCATEIQAALRTRNEHLAPEEKMLFRMGINLGDVIVQGEDLLGDGVNVAARIQTATEPGGICISGSVYDQIQNKLSLDFKLLGEQTYKNIAKPVRTYTINEGVAVTAPAPRRSSKLPAAIAAAVLVIGGAGYWGYQQYDARRAEQVRIESQLSAQLAAQKQATEQAQRAAEDAKRDAQLQAQKQLAEEAMRRAQEERNRVEQDRKLLETEKRVADAAKKQATEQAQRAAEDAKRDAQLQAQKQAAAETLRRAQEERNRLEQDRKLLETEKRVADAAKKQAAASQRAAPAATIAPKSATPHDGFYSGRLCSYPKDDPKPNCWPVALFVRNGIAEGSYPSWGLTTKINGTIAANGALELKLAGWTRNGNPFDGALAGRVTDDAITASGLWQDGRAVSGDWKRAQEERNRVEQDRKLLETEKRVADAAQKQAAASQRATPAATLAPKSATPHDGAYSGRLCNYPKGDPKPNCWSVALVVRNGIAEGNWISRSTQKASSANGTIAANGAVELRLAAWTRKGNSIDGILAGRVADDAITASGQWRDGAAITGDWKRTQ